MQRIKVVKKQVKKVPKGGIVVTVYDVKGAHYSGSRASLQEVEAGDTIDAEIEVDGKSINILSFEFVERSTGNGSSGNQNLDKYLEVTGRLMEAGIVKRDEPLGEAVIASCYLRLTGKILDAVEKKQESKPKPEPKPEPEPEPQPAPETEPSPPEVEPELLGFVNRQWFDDTLKELQGKGLKLWADSKVLELLNAWVSEDGQGEAKTIEEALKRLPREKAEKLTDKMREQLELA